MEQKELENTILGRIRYEIRVGIGEAKNVKQAKVIVERNLERLQADETIRGWKLKDPERLWDDFSIEDKIKWFLIFQIFTWVGKQMKWILSERRRFYDQYRKVPEKDKSILSEFQFRPLPLWCDPDAKDINFPMIEVQTFVGVKRFTMNLEVL
jgi:hypothetical protein